MAVKLKKPAAAEPMPTIVKTKSVGSGNMAYVRLVNGCSTYVTPEREIFYARDEATNQPRVYEVDAAIMDRLLSYRDDYSRRFFRQVAKPETATATVAKVNDPEPVAPKRLRDDDTIEDEDGQIDTGAVALQDADGKPVGVVV